MGEYYHYVNFSKKLSASISAIDGGDKKYDIGRSLTARAFALLLSRISYGYADRFHWMVGSWEKDHVAVVGDYDADYEMIDEKFTSFDANLFMLLIDVDGFEEIAEIVKEDDNLFLQVCYLIETNQAPELLPEMKEHFGEDFWNRRKQIRSFSFRPVDLVPEPS